MQMCVLANSEIELKMEMPTMKKTLQLFLSVTLLSYSNLYVCFSKQNGDISVSGRKQESKAGSLIQKEACFKNRASEYKGLTVASPVSMAQPLYHGNGMPVGSSMWV